MKPLILLKLIFSISKCQAFFTTQEQDELELDLKTRIFQKLDNPVSLKVDYFKPSSLMFQNYKELSMLNNSPATNYTIDEENPKVSRMTRDIWQFGPSEVDRYKFTFSVHPDAVEVVDDAELRIFKMKPNLFQKSQAESNEPALFNSAYVSLVDEENKIFSSEMVNVYKSEWVKLDCTDFIRDCLSNSSKNDTSINITVLIESLSNHHKAIQSARQIRLAHQQQVAKNIRPSLAIHTISGKRYLARQEKYRSCKNVQMNSDFDDLIFKPSTTRSCCKGSQTLNLNLVDWNIEWLIEPTFIKLSKCGGKCSNDKKICVPVERKSLTIFYLSMNKFGQIFERVDVLPNFVVEKCACRFVI